MSEKSDGRKLSKKEQRRQELEREERMRKLRIIVPVVVLVLAFLAFVAYRAFRPEIPGVEQVTAEPGGNHDDELHLEFGGLPPMGGPHASNWQNCGIYTEAVVFPEYAIHSMEHGAVWITYHPDLPDEQIAALQDVAQGEAKILLSPYPDQTSPIVLTVWDRQLVLEDASDERIDQFIARYRSQTGPEANASCVNGVGVPAS
jgi:hypothetical protein